MDKDKLHTLRMRNTEGCIGTLQWRPSIQRWRLTRWRTCGPTGHDQHTDDQLERELRHFWKIDPTAGAELEQWADAPEWERGLLRFQFTACWNACTWNGRYDLARGLDHYATEHGLEAAITQHVPIIYAQLKEMAR